MGWEQMGAVANRIDAVVQGRKSPMGRLGQIKAEQHLRASDVSEVIVVSAPPIAVPPDGPSLLTLPEHSVCSMHMCE